MRETPDAYHRRTGARVPATDVSVAGPILGTRPRPPAPDEPCPTLYRDVGPQALAQFIRSEATQFEGRGSACAFLRDATLPAYSSCVEQFGALVLLQPLALGPWVSGQAGIWVSEAGRMPPPDVVAIVPAGADLPTFDARIEMAANRSEYREALGGREYDDQLEASVRALDEYLADWSRVEEARRPVRARLSSTDPAARHAALAVLGALGLYEKDLEANWFHVTPERRDEVRARLPEAARRLSGLSP